MLIDFSAEIIECGDVNLHKFKKLQCKLHGLFIEKDAISVQCLTKSKSRENFYQRVTGTAGKKNPREPPPPEYTALEKTPGEILSEKPPR